MALSAQQQNGMCQLFTICIHNLHNDHFMIHIQVWEPLIHHNQKDLGPSRYLEQS